MNNRSDNILTLTAQAAGTVNSLMQQNLDGRGLLLVIDVTAISGTSPTLTVTVKGHDAASDKDFTLLASAALAAVGTTVLTIYPGAAVTANVSANSPLPLEWSVSAVVGGTTPSVTATVGANVIK